MRWFVLSFATLAAVTVIALTAIDKRDEQSCKDRVVGGRTSIHARDVAARECQGFLPW